jgi:hypothetical protein
MKTLISSAFLFAMASISLPGIGLAQSSLDPAAQQSTGAVKPAAATPAARQPAAPSLNGTWVGQVTELGRDKPFAIVVTIDPNGATTAYPDQGCSGKLTRVGSSGAYIFFAEKITQGVYDKTKNTGCLDGTLEIARSGSNALMSWFGVFDNQPYQAAATLTLRQGQATPVAVNKD